MLKLSKKKIRRKLYDLVAELRQLPDDYLPEEVDDPDDHPLLKLMVEKASGLFDYGQSYNPLSKQELLHTIPLVTSKKGAVTQILFLEVRN